MTRRLTELQKAQLWARTWQNNFQTSQRMDGLDIPLSGEIPPLPVTQHAVSEQFGSGKDPYFWSNSAVLRNRLDIRDARRLQQAELESSALRAAMLPFGSLKRGLPNLCEIHRQLFQDVYSWAGKFREVDIYKGETRFCHFEYIEKEGNALMRSLEDEHYLTELPQLQFIVRLTHYYCELNVLHPFRTGNGRVLRIFCEQMAIHAGYLLDWEGVDPGQWQQANQNGAMGDSVLLEAIFSKVVREATEIE